MRHVRYTKPMPMMVLKWIAEGVRYRFPPCCIAAFIVSGVRQRPGERILPKPIIHRDDPRRVRRGCPMCAWRHGVQAEVA